jgi:DNA ligase-1
MNRPFEPILSGKADIKKIDADSFPKIASPKLDGIRCLTTELGVVSRKLKLIPNKYITDCLSDLEPGFDGEIITYTDGAMDDFNTIQSKVMRGSGETDFEYFVFDYFVDAQAEYSDRIEVLRARCQSMDHAYVRFVPVVTVDNAHTLKQLFDQHLLNGWEGTMIRKPSGPYKYGRSSPREGYLDKLKVLEDSEGVITGFIEQVENTNAKEKDERGKTKRSSRKAGKVPKDTLGAILMTWRGIENCKVSTGMSNKLRKEIWDNRADYMSQLVTFQFQGIGPNGKPRFPAFKGIRHPDDT